MAKKDVFISYSSKELEEANWVKSVLENNGISCWMAPSCIPGGSNYAVEIPGAIRGAKVFVLILSSMAQKSVWVSREVDLAINEQKIILPFMLENCELRDDFNFYLTNVQRYPAYENKVAAAQTMVNEIKALLGNKSKDTVVEEPVKAEPVKAQVTESVKHEPVKAAPVKESPVAKPVTPPAAKPEKTVNDPFMNISSNDPFAKVQSNDPFLNVQSNDPFAKAVSRDPFSQTVEEKASSGQEKNNMSLICLISGIVSLVLFLFVLTGMIPMILSVINLKKLKNTNNERAKKQSLIGGILGMFSVLAGFSLYGYIPGFIIGLVICIPFYYFIFRFYKK